jgi:hypothetical protein
MRKTGTASRAVRKPQHDIHNAKVELDAAGNRKLSKRRSIGRIDPLVALCMALGIAARPAPAFDIEAMIG